MRKLQLATAAMLLLLFVQCTKKDSYTIKGEFDTEKFPSQVYIYDIDLNAIDSAKVENGTFTLTGHIKQPEKVIIGNVNSKEPLGITVFLENVPFSIKVTSDSYEVEGGKIQKLIYGFYDTEKYKELMTEYEAILEKSFNDSTNTMAEESGKLIKSLEEKLFNIEFKSFRNILEGNYPTNTKLLALSTTQDWKGYPVEKQMKMLDEYEKELGKNKLIDHHRKYLTADTGNPAEENTAMKEPEIGENFTDVIATDTEGNQVKLSEVIAKNKYVILEFWASWCSPCRAEIPNLKKAYDKFKSKGLEIYSISLDEKAEKWLEASKEENTPWLNLHAQEAFKSEAAIAYGVNAIPSSFLISKEGKIVAKGGELRGGFLNKTLNNYLK